MSRILTLDEPELEAHSLPNGPPAKLEAAALRGIAGEIVGKILPHTEAGEAALLFSLLAGFGNQAGREAYTVAGNTRHHARLYGVLAGITSGGRKGTSWSCIRDILRETDEDWQRDCLKSGLHSGEGLIHRVRDERREQKPVKEGGRIVDYQDEIVDAGVDDKRLFLIEEEFASILKRMKGRENSLSIILRNAWDGSDLESLIKNSPDRATAPHVSVLGHITRTEAKAEISESDYHNGFVNRFLWIYTNRSKCLPDGGLIPIGELRQEIEALKNALHFARHQRGEIPLSPEANELWRVVYPALSETKPGLFGAVTGRAEAQVRRLSLAWALIEGRTEQSIENMEAALAFWRYCEQTAGWLFGTPFNHPDADRIYEALRKRPEGMTRTEINGEVFSNHRTKEQLDEALAILETAGAAYPEREPTGGANRERWFLTNPAK